MKKTLAILAALFLPMAASAACVWTTNSITEATVVCGDGDEVAPTLATEGLDTSNCKRGISVFVYADSTRTFSGAGTVRFYAYDAASGLWGSIPDMDLTVGTASVRALAFPGVWLASPGGRIAIVPVGVTLSAGGFTGHLICN